MTMGDLGEAYKENSEMAKAIAEEHPPKRKKWIQTGRPNSRIANGSNGTWPSQDFGNT